MSLGIFLFLTLVAYGIGTFVEKRHYQSIKKREIESLNLPAVNIKRAPTNKQITGVQMVSGSAVISLDYFKRVVASLRMLLGGRVRTYESLIDRARREAILRMKQSCQFDTGIILNVRVETSSIGKSANSKNQIGSIEAIAYGTAIYFAKNDAQ
mgnify:FL=1